MKPTPVIAAALGLTTLGAAALLVRTRTPHTNETPAASASVVALCGAPIGSALTGKLVLSVSERSGTEYSLHLKAMAPLEWRGALRQLSDGTRAGTGEALRELGVGLRLEPNCRVSALWVPGPKTAPERRFAATFGALVDVEVQPGEAWRARHVDASGEYAAAYEALSDGRVRRRRIGYLSSGGRNVRVSGQSEFRRANGWLGEVHVNETFQADGVSLPVAFDLTLAPSTEPISVPSEGDGEWVALQALVQSKSDSMELEKQDLTQDWQVLTGPDTDAARDQAIAFGHSGATNPAIVERLRLATRELAQERRPPIYLALRIAGTAEAQAALLEAANDPGRTESDRVNALVATHDLASPTRRLIDELERVAHERSPEGPANAALLALGSLAHLDPLAEKHLLEALARARASDAVTSTLLEALGNSTLPRFEQDLIAFTRAENEDLRLAAVHSLRSYSGDATFLALVARLESDSNEPVLDVTAQRLAPMVKRRTCGASGQAVAVAAHRLTQRAWLPGTERNLIRLVGECPADPAAIEALKAALRRSSDAGLRVEAGRYLSAADAADALSRGAPTKP